MKYSAGLLIYRKKSNQIEVLIAHMGAPWWAKKDVGAWSIPKGEYSDTEDPEATAEREFEEELGIKPPQGERYELGVIKQNNNKNVVAWALEGDLDVRHTTSNTFKVEWPPRSGKIQEFPEIDRADWFSLEEAAQKLIPAQVEFLQRLAEKLGVKFNPSGHEEPDKPKQNTLFRLQ